MREPGCFTVEPYTENCRTIWRRAEHVLVGVSPGNGYFSEARLTALLGWADARFARVDAIVPDVSVAHTYRALGHPPETARRKARQKAGEVYRRIGRAWAAAGVPTGRRRVCLLSEFVDLPAYRTLLSRVELAVTRDAAVRATFLEAARRALTSRLKGAPPTAEQVEEGRHYLTAEMPLCLDTPSIMDVGTSVNVYHQLLPAVPLMFGSEHLDMSPRQAFATVRQTTKTFPASSASPVSSAPAVRA
jgi:cyclo(L-tyrosyl-L-tyrosyl) synthase